MARNRGCCRSAKRALTRDCSPVRLPNCVEGYLWAGEKPVTAGAANTNSQLGLQRRDSSNHTLG